MMRVEEPKARKLEPGLMERAIEFHGHGGPFMVVGLRMGLLALERLGARGWFDISCRARLRWGPPDSCVVDGIQISSGCTTGKHNMEVEEAEGIQAEFTVEEARLVVRLRTDTLERIRDALESGDESVIRSLMSELAEASEGDVFEVTRVDA
jgi:formylmethanofuran dehydrogenase subunit E